MEGKVQFFSYVFYGKPETNDQDYSWSLLSQINMEVGVPWYFFSDFNEIVSQDEKVGGRLRHASQMQKFQQAMELNGLYDLGWKG